MVYFYEIMYFVITLNIFVQVVFMNYYLFLKIRLILFLAKKKDLFGPTFKWCGWRDLNHTKIIGKVILEYYILYDLNDNIICYFDNLFEISKKFGYPIKELNRKYRKSLDNSINLVLENVYYKLFCFK